MCVFTNARDSQVSEERITIGRQIGEAITRVSLVWLTCTCPGVDQLLQTWPPRLPSLVPEIGMHVAIG